MILDFTCILLQCHCRKDRWSVSAASAAAEAECTAGNWSSSDSTAHGCRLRKKFDSGCGNRVSALPNIRVLLPLHAEPLAPHTTSGTRP